MFLSESKVTGRLHQNVGHIEKFLRKKHHPGRSQGDGRYERLSANTSLESRRPTRTAVGHFSPLGTMTRELPESLRVFDAEGSLASFSTTPPVGALGARRGRTSHYIQLTSVSRKRQDVSRQTEHPIRSTNRGSTLLFRESATGDSNPSSRARPVCSRYTNIYNELSYIGRITL